MNIRHHTDFISIRPMTLDDIDSVMEIERMSFSLPWSENSYRYDLTKQPAARLWVAELENENGGKTLAGVIVIWLIIDEAHVGTISIHPDYRRLGIGRSLLAHALKEAAAEGALNSYLEVRKSNTAAQALYAKFGYQTISIRRKYYQDNKEDALLMVLDHLDDI